MKYKIRALFYKIKYWVSPRQRWLTKTIPKHWSDKVELIPQILFACLIHFVEEEEGLDQLTRTWEGDVKEGWVTQEYADSVKKNYTELQDAYNYVKNERAVLQQQELDSYPEISFVHTGSFRVTYAIENQTNEERYGESNRLEKLIAEKDQWAMNIITKHVGILWT